MSLRSHTYVSGLRWETRLVITYIVFACCAVVTMLNVEPVAAYIVLGTLCILGTALAATLRSLLRDDYLHTTPAMTAVALVPPFSLATVHVGMISSWMQRVGFGVPMRVGVSSLLLWSVVSVGLHCSLGESALLLAASITTAALRNLAPMSLYLVPWVAMTLGFIISMAMHP